jgi:streptomycin 6-kinase
MAQRGSQWADWVQTLPSTVQRLAGQWELRSDGPPTHGHCSLVLPVRTADGTASMLKVGFPEPDSEHEHLALRRWGGHGAVRLLSADPRARALLLERLQPTDLSGLPEVQACEVVADLYRQLHVPALASLRTLSEFIARQTADLADLPRDAPIPRRLVEQAVALGGDLAADRSVPDRVIHTDLHYGNVLAGGRQPWLAIDPKPLNGDPHYELAPMLWNRLEDVRGGVRRRLWTLVDAAGFDEERARAWVLVRMMHNAMWSVHDGAQSDPAWLTTCIAVAKAVQD